MAYSSSYLCYVENTFDSDDRQAHTTIDSDHDGGNRPVRAGIGCKEQENPNAVIPESSPEEYSIGPDDIVSPKPDDRVAHGSVSVPQQGVGSAPRACAVSESLYLTSSDGEAQSFVPPRDSPFTTKAQPRRIERVVDQSKRLPFANTSPV